MTQDTYEKFDTPADALMDALLAGLLDATVQQNALDRMSSYFNSVAARGASPWWKRAAYRIMRQRRRNQDEISKLCEQIEDLNRTDPIVASTGTIDPLDPLRGAGGHKGTQNPDDAA